MTYEVAKAFVDLVEWTRQKHGKGDVFCISLDLADEIVTRLRLDLIPKRPEEVA